MELHALKANVTELMHVFAILCLPFFAVLFLSLLLVVVLLKALCF